MYLGLRILPTGRFQVGNPDSVLLAPASFYSCGKWGDARSCLARPATTVCDALLTALQTQTSPPEGNQPGARVDLSESNQTVGWDSRKPAKACRCRGTRQSNDKGPPRAVSFAGRTTFGDSSPPLCALGLLEVSESLNPFPQRGRSRGGEQTNSTVRDVSGSNYQSELNWTGWKNGRPSMLGRAGCATGRSQGRVSPSRGLG